MTEYIVTWTIQLTADTPVDAAKMALEIHRDPTSAATYFKVQESTPGGLTFNVDLGVPGEEPQGHEPEPDREPGHDQFEREGAFEPPVHAGEVVEDHVTAPRGRA